MKAVRYHSVGDVDVLRWETAPDPRGGPEDVLVRVEAAGVNFADLMRRSGKYHFKVAFPALLGTEGAGVAVTVGEKVQGIEIGDRVFFRTALVGCQAELIAVPADELFRMPPSLSFVDAAAVPVAFLTAYHLLKTIAPLRRGEVVLIHAAASGVGTAAIQLAKLWGARILATASTDQKLELAQRLGASHCINYVERDFVTEVLSLTDGGGVDRVLECVGGEVLTRSVDALAPGGRLFIYGRASGSLPSLPLEQVFSKNLQVIGLNIGGRPWTSDTHRVALEEIVSILQLGHVRPVVHKVLPMSLVADAHRLLTNRSTMGKVVLVREESE